MDRWMSKKDMVYKCNGILLSHKKDKTFAICGNMDESWGYYVIWNKSDDERQIVWFYSYVGYKKLINKKSPQTN